MIVKSSEKERLDVFLHNSFPVESREKAKTIIMSGVVYVNNQKADKVGFIVKPGDIVEMRKNPLKYVSRGGLKLEKAIDEFNICLKDFICADIGASTGGFTDCMLKNGAKKVYSVDVGYGQLAWTLRNDPRVVNLERTNFRYVTHKEIPDFLDFASVDVSFISLKHILPPLQKLLKNCAFAVLLIKPQFEAGKEKVGKHGVVKDKAIHKEVIEDVSHYIQENGFSFVNISFSPIKGPEGNIEYLALIQKCDRIANNVTCEKIENVVELSHKLLD